MFNSNNRVRLTRTSSLFNAIHIKSTTAGPHVLITAGVHGDEYEPIMAAVALQEMLSELLIAGEVSIVPIVNLNAFELRTRTADDGLDLARICPGNPDGSISEKVAAKISEYISAADYYIDMHTGGKIFDIYPLAGYMLHSSPDVLDKQRAMAMAFNLPVIWGTDDAPNGRTLSVARDAGVPAIYIEYGGGDRIRQEVIEAYKEGCMNVLRGLDMLVHKKTQTGQVKHKVEDYTSNNGYLQGKLPAPHRGFFIPALSVGQKVKKGELWGYVSSVADNDKTEVFADIDGIVLFLRTSFFVEEGDSLGGILPILKAGKITINGKK